MKTSEETKNLYIKSLSDFTPPVIEEYVEVSTHNVEGPFLELKGNSKKLILLKYRMTKIIYYTKMT